MAKKKMEKKCCSGGHHKCIGVCMLIVGVLILINAYFGLVNWGIFIGGIVALKGLIMLVKPCCS